MAGHLLILGPQRPEPTLSRALGRAGVEGPVALVSAGWRHDEGEIRAIVRHLARPLHHLTLYRWFEEISHEEPRLAAAYKARQRKIVEFKSAIRRRLHAALSAVDKLESLRVRDPELYDEEIADAMDAVRSLDDRVAERVAEIHAAYPEAARPWDYPRIRARHDEMEAILREVSAVCIAGGHVGVLRNRLLFFGLEQLLARAVADGVSVAAWSAGAMALSSRIVLFYDDPPDGRGGAEVHGSGLGLLPGHVFLPHAANRLRLDDAQRIGRLVRRFQPLTCVALEPGADLELTGEGLVDHGAADTAWGLTTSGERVRL